jgi:addiction module HigA family antidote
MIERYAPIHPGQILNEEFLEPYEMSQYLLAKLMGVSARRINEIVQGKRGITADTSIRLGRIFRMSDEFFLNLQKHYDLEIERDRLEAEYVKIIPYPKPKDSGKKTKAS